LLYEKNDFAEGSKILLIWK